MFTRGAVVLLLTVLPRIMTPTSTTQGRCLLRPYLRQSTAQLASSLVLALEIARDVLQLSHVVLKHFKFGSKVAELFLLDAHVFHRISGCFIDLLEDLFEPIVDFLVAHCTEDHISLVFEFCKGPNEC